MPKASGGAAAVAAMLALFEETASADPRAGSKTAPGLPAAVADNLLTLTWGCPR